MEIDTKSMLKDFQEELNDSDKYYEIGSKMRVDVTFSKKAKGFFEMSKDEFTHARWLRDILIMHSVEIPTADNERYELIKERTYRLFL